MCGWNGRRGNRIHAGRNDVVVVARGRLLDSCLHVPLTIATIAMARLLLLPLLLR